MNKDEAWKKFKETGKINHQVIKEHWDYYEKNNI